MSKKIPGKFIYYPVIFFVLFELTFRALNLPGKYGNPLIGLNETILSTTLNTQKEFSTNTILLGSEFGFEGLDMIQLNQILSKKGMRVQNLSIPYSNPLIHLLTLETVLRSNSEIKYIVHIPNPLEEKKSISETSFSLLTNFPLLRVITKINEFSYELSFSQWLRLLFKSAQIIHYLTSLFDPEPSYIPDEIMDSQDSPYLYLNARKDSIRDLHSSENIDCSIFKNKFENLSSIDFTSQITSIQEYCNSEKSSNPASNIQASFFLIRMSVLYEFFSKKNLQVYLIRPPALFWEERKESEKLFSHWNQMNKESSITQWIDLSEVYPQSNPSEYFYDPIRPNQKGMKIFTEELGYEILKKNTSLGQ